MKLNTEIAPSVLSADFSCLKKEILAVQKAGADRIHIDIMDGHFVPQITMGSRAVQTIKQISYLPLDVHLMVEKPENHIQSFASAGASSLIVHIESLSDPKNTLKQIRQKKILAGITLKPSTSVQKIFPFLDYVDLILVMTVEPGKSGQKILPTSVEKISAIRQKLIQKRISIPIHVDGGVNNQVLPSLTGADVLVSGDFIFKHTSYKTAISLLKKHDLQNNPQKNLKPPTKIKGAIIVEYMLLLVVCVALALILADLVKIGSSDDQHGWIIGKWLNVIKVIAEDL